MVIVCSGGWPSCHERTLDNCHGGSYAYQTDQATQLIDPSATRAYLGLTGGSMLWRTDGLLPRHWQGLHPPAANDCIALYQPVVDHRAGAPRLSAGQGSGPQSGCRPGAVVGAGSGGDSVDAPGLPGVAVGVIFQYLFDP